MTAVNEYDPRHPHEREHGVLPQLTADGSCLICHIEVGYIDQIAAERAERERVLEVLSTTNRQLLHAMQVPHLYHASTRELRQTLALRARMRLPWNRVKTVHPTNGHGTWLPVYWVWSRVDGDPLSQLGRTRWLKELDHPYRRGRGLGFKAGNVLLEVGVCYRKNLEPDPDEFGDYDDPGAVDALQARVLDDSIDSISTEYRGISGAAPQTDA